MSSDHGADKRSEHSDLEYRAEMVRKGKNPDLPANHPVNALSPLRKFLVLATLSYTGLLGNFAIAIILVAFVPMGKQFGVSPGLIANTLGYQLLGVAFGPILWNPLSKTVGRRPVYLLGTFLYIPCCIWLALSNSYTSYVVARLVTGLLSAWSQTIPPATVADIYPAEVRGDKMALYGMANVIAPAVAPLFSGLIVYKHSWRILFWFILALAGLQLILIFVVVPETLWVEDDHSNEPVAPALATENKTEQADHVDKHHPAAHIEGREPTHDVEEHHQATLGSHIKSGHVGVAWYPWQRPREYLRISLSPVMMLRYFVITVPSFYYGMLFAWSVGITVTAPQLLEKPPYSFATIPLGCSFLAFGIGGVLGKWSGGIVADKTVAYIERKHGYREPEDRLWALLPNLPLMFVSMLIIGFAISRSLHWMALLMGGAIYYYTLSAATGIIQTYTIECYLARTMDTQAVFTFWKMLWGFVIPFFVVQWGQKDGFLASSAAQGAIAAGLGALLCALLLWKGKAIRMAQGMPEFEK